MDGDYIDPTQQFPMHRRWNATLRLGVGGNHDYIAAVEQPGEAPNDLRMPSETEDGSVKMKEPMEMPLDGQPWKPPLVELPDRCQQHEFINEQRHPKYPFGVSMGAYFLAPCSEEMKERLKLHQENFRKAGVPARHLPFLADLWASERLPWERTPQGWYGTVSNLGYQRVIEDRHYDHFGLQWHVPKEALRVKTDFEVALATQLAPSEADMKVYGLKDPAEGLSEHERALGERKKYRTADEDVGFATRKFGPPGLAEPLLLSNSLGNHRFHSYRGGWKRGRMHDVRGTYRFADDTEYEGGWEDGARCGWGKTTYKDGSTYEGGWKEGFLHGTGTMRYGNGVVYEGEWQRGVRHGKGKLSMTRSRATWEGDFYAGLRHGTGKHTSEATGISFEGTYVKGRVQGHGSLVIKDKKDPNAVLKQRRIRRGLWHKSEFAPSGQINMKDLVSIVDKEDAKATRQKATDYVAIHGTVLAAQLNDWCFKIKKELRDARNEKKRAEEEERRQKVIDQKNAMAELRKQAKEARDKKKNESDSDPDDDDDEPAAGDDEDEPDD